eukprot:4391173-Prymnesium_polylepis.1
MGQVIRTAAHRFEQLAGSALPLLRRNWTECERYAAGGAPAVCLVEHARWETLRPAIEGGLQLVHMLRDPVEVCVSGYQYHRVTSEEWVHQPRKALGGRTWQQYLLSASRVEGQLAECTRGLTELRDQAELHVRAKPYANVHATRLEQVSSNYSHQITNVLNHMLRAVRVEASTAGGGAHGGHAHANGTVLGRTESTPLRPNGTRADVTAERLLKAVEKFDLNHNAPTSDKVSHVSNLVRVRACAVCHKCASRTARVHQHATR